jgi:hypothetical protein
LFSSAAFLMLSPVVSALRMFPKYQRIMTSFYKALCIECTLRFDAELFFMTMIVTYLHIKDSMTLKSLTCPAIFNS